MLKGIGIDIIEIVRIKEAVKKHGPAFLKRIYTAKELAYCQARQAVRFPELAVRFAAKEAYAKAVGTGINKALSWKEIEVINNRRGQPFLAIKGRGNKKVHLSLSHSRDYAVATVYVEK